MAKFYTQKEEEFIINNYYKLGTENCSKIFDVSVVSFREKLNRLKLKAIGNPFPNLSQEEIEKIRQEICPKELDINFDTNPNKKELAYFLGFLWSDGYVNKKLGNRIMIEITEEDGTEIFDILKVLADFRIYKRVRKNRKPQMSFYCSSSKICDFLESLGKYSNSIESHEKIITYVPEKYHKWFLRGYVDGDGCFYLNEKRNNIQFSICGSKYQNWDGLLTLCKKFGLTHIVAKIRQDSNHGNSSIIRATNRSEIKNFIEKLYLEKDNVWLPRKYIKAQKILNYINNKIKNE